MLESVARRLSLWPQPQADGDTHLSDLVATRRNRMAKPVPMEPTTETVVSFLRVARGNGQDECHEPQVDHCVPGVSESSHLSHGCDRERDQSSAESVDRDVADSDGVQIQMTAEVETETETQWLDDVGVTEWLDDINVVRHSVQMDVSDCHCTPPHPPVDAARCMSPASQQHNLDATDSGISISSTESDLNECFCRSGLRATQTRIWFALTAACATLTDCMILLVV